MKMVSVLRISLALLFAILLFACGGGGGGSTSGNGGSSGETVINGRA